MYKDKLKELRSNANVKQKEIAKYLNISESSYATYENEIDIFPIKHLNHVCNFFDVSLDYIFNLNNEKYSIVNKDIISELSGLRLKEFRKNNNLTQAKLAKMLNSDDSTISKYEKGINIISTSFLYIISMKYKISADYLLGKTSEPKYLK